MPKGVYKKSPEHLNKMRKHLKKHNVKGECSPAWKGDMVGYYGVHKWIYSTIGKANHCSVCGIQTGRKFGWANISGEYRRDVNDFKAMCTSCHTKYDKSKKNHKKQLQLF